MIVSYTARRNIPLDWNLLYLFNLSVTRDYALLRERLYVLSSGSSV